MLESEEIVTMAHNFYERVIRTAYWVYGPQYKQFFRYRIITPLPRCISPFREFTDVVEKDGQRVFAMRTDMGRICISYYVDNKERVLISMVKNESRIGAGLITASFTNESLNIYCEKIKPARFYYEYPETFDVDRIIQFMFRMADKKLRRMV